jgi:hypothetical protein
VFYILYGMVSEEGCHDDSDKVFDSLLGSNSKNKSSEPDAMEISDDCSPVKPPSKGEAPPFLSYNILYFQSCLSC